MTLLMASKVQSQLYLSQHNPPSYPVYCCFTKKHALSLEEYLKIKPGL